MEYHESVDLNKPRHTWEEGLSAEELPLSEWPVVMSVGPFLDCQLMWESPTHNGAIPGQVGWLFKKSV